MKRFFAFSLIVLCLFAWFLFAVSGSMKAEPVERDGLFYRGNSKEPFSGTYEAKDDSGRKYRVIFVDGKKEGLSVTWHKNGKQAHVSFYKNGQQHGLTTWWHEAGEKYKEETYQDGKLIKETTFD